MKFSIKQAIVLCSLFASIIPFISIANANEDAKPVFDNREWVLGWSQVQGAAGKGGVVYDEYVLKDEKVDNWSELITIQFMPGLNKDTNLDVFEGRNKTRMTNICPNIKWDSLYQQEDERMWQFTIKDCPGQPDQSELMRVVKTDEGFHMFHYVTKKAPMPEDVKNTWMKNLKAIKIIQSASH